MVDVDVLQRKTLAIRHYRERLRAYGALTAGQLVADETLWNSVTMDLLQVIQPCIDLALHTVVDDVLGTPAEAAGAFALLGSAGVIPRALAIRMAAAVGLRNLIVHRYGDLDAELIVSVVAHELEHVDEFVRLIEVWARSA